MSTPTDPPPLPCDARVAPCVISDEPERWFDPSVTASAAARLCSGCPVTGECLTAAMTMEAGASVYGRWGVWAGMTPVQRALLHRRRTRAARTTKEGHAMKLTTRPSRSRSTPAAAR